MTSPDTVSRMMKILLPLRGKDVAVHHKAPLPLNGYQRKAFIKDDIIRKVAHGKYRVTTSLSEGTVRDALSLSNSIQRDYAKKRTKDAKAPAKRMNGNGHASMSALFKVFKTAEKDKQRADKVFDRAKKNLAAALR